MAVEHQVRLYARFTRQARERVQHYITQEKNQASLKARKGSGYGGARQIIRGTIFAKGGESASGCRALS